MYRLKLFILDNEADCNTAVDSRGEDATITPLLDGTSESYETAVCPMNVTKVIHPEVDPSILFALPNGDVLDGGLQVDFPNEQVNLAAFINDQPYAKELWERDHELWIAAIMTSPVMEPWTGLNLIWAIAGHITEENGYYRIDTMYKQYDQDAIRFVTTSEMA